uniref:Uncharacterized protein n=1 Tax=Rhizophora mucronata TaxID=61149 RepID=A0A2P2QRW5_RHIMU
MHTLLYLQHFLSRVDFNLCFKLGG